METHVTIPSSDVCGSGDGILGGAREFAFLTASQVTLVLQVCRQGHIPF